MAQAHVASSACIPVPHVTAITSARARSLPRLPHPSKISGLASSFKGGSSLLLWKASRKRNPQFQANPLSIRCEQRVKDSSGLDVWLGRIAMVGFATAITVEIATGKGLLENFGFITPLPTLALVVTALVGVLTAFFIFQSASRD